MAFPLPARRQGAAPDGAARLKRRSLLRDRRRRRKLRLKPAVFDASVAVDHTESRGELHGVAA